MTAYEYLRLIENQNRKLFAAEKIELRPASLEKVIIDAFESGRKAGQQENEEAKSLFEKIFG